MKPVDVVRERFLSPFTLCRVEIRVESDLIDNKKGLRFLI